MLPKLQECGCSDAVAAVKRLAGWSAFVVGSTRRSADLSATVAGGGEQQPCRSSIRLAASCWPLGVEQLRKHVWPASFQLPPSYAPRRVTALWPITTPINLRLSTAAAGLRREEHAVLREMRFHFASTLTALGTSTLDALCKDYEVGRAV